MHESLVFKRCWLSFNLFINLMIESFNFASFFSKKLWSIIFPIILNFMFSIFFFKVRIEWFRIKASSNESSATSTDKEFILQLLLFNILCRVLRLNSISLKLILCELDWIYFEKMLNFWSLLILYFESIFCCFVLREMFNNFVNCMHCFSSNQLYWSNWTLWLPWRQLWLWMRIAFEVSVLLILLNRLGSWSSFRLLKNFRSTVILWFFRKWRIFNWYWFLLLVWA